ncbi:two-component response regulator-like APRR5 [Euphorbia lathyris]|uniref:two-component response regulator-like APRR5 n=1 Tax=Euphorbia lathyris TaxID=212925 RepID=UPI003314009D
MGEVVRSGGGRMEADVVMGKEEPGNNEQRRGTDDKNGSSEVVRWEKFLPRMVLRVLLVEADDSTRHIISALLRKCSYKVSAVPDGLMAWETLKGGPHNIDLILTEVELPSISGYALLTLVMEDDICKKIPVIMMSSQDSISTVLKCMLKGAADFLIKPVRRNELKNLWQHVWRRLTLNAGHNPQDSPNAQGKIEAGSENNSTSDHSSDCATSSRKRKERSDEGSDFQMECRIGSNPSNTEKETYKEGLISDEKPVIPDTKSRDWSTRLESVGASHNEDHNPAALELGEEFTCNKIRIQDENVKPENNRENVISSHGPNSELVQSSGGVIDLIGTFVDGPKCTYGHLNMHDGINKLEFTPQLELSLTRFNLTDSNNQEVEGWHALNHSNASAFSWYNNKTLQPLFPIETSKSTEFKENVSKSLKQSSDAVCQNANGDPQESGANLNGSQESETTLVIGQSAEAQLAYQNNQKLIPVSGVRLDDTCNEYIHDTPPACHAQTVLPERWSPKPASEQEDSPFSISTSIHPNPETQNHENKVDETAINSASQNMHQHNNVEVVEEVRHDSPASCYSRSSSMSNSVADHNNSSAYGSFSGRSDGNASFAATSEKANVPESLNDSGRPFVRDGFRGMDAHRSSQREAALTKFRLKRKDRCYEKKVRYQSRKRLAEQRPRVKGQFVRQVQNDALIADANE